VILLHGFKCVAAFISRCRVEHPARLVRAQRSDHVEDIDSITVAGHVRDPHCRGTSKKAASDCVVGTLHELVLFCGVCTRSTEGTNGRRASETCAGTCISTVLENGDPQTIILQYSVWCFGKGAYRCASVDVQCRLQLPHDRPPPHLRLAEDDFLRTQGSRFRYRPPSPSPSRRR
jgi:hypothetical protein